MQKSLKEKYWDKFSYHPIDNGDETRKKQSSLVEQMNNEEWIKKYNPDIIICSRLPAHPVTLLPKDFNCRYDELFGKRYHNLNDKEKKEFIEMEKIRDDKKAWDDETSNRRKNSNLKEYILIGMVDETWSSEKTYWFDEKDWFIKKELPILTINYHDAIAWDIDLRNRSQVFSFKRDNK